MNYLNSIVISVDRQKLLKYFVSMDADLDKLEKAVSRTVRYLAELKKSPAAGGPAGKRKEAAVIQSLSQKKAMEDLSRENRRLQEERKDLRRRVRALIRDIDRVKW
jgi:FtsZ-binding cell division protein ZapB